MRLKLRLSVSQEPLCKCGAERRAVPDKLCLSPKACWERVPDCKGLQSGDTPHGLGVLIFKKEFLHLIQKPTALQMRPPSKLSLNRLDTQTE